MDKVKLLKDTEAHYWDELEKAQGYAVDRTDYIIRSLLNIRALLAQMDTKGLEDK